MSNDGLIDRIAIQLDADPIDIVFEIERVRKHRRGYDKNRGVRHRVGVGCRQRLLRGSHADAYPIERRLNVGRGVGPGRILILQFEIPTGRGAAESRYWAVQIDQIDIAGCMAHR